MLDARIKYLRKVGASTQSSISSVTPKAIDDDIHMLWKTFVDSKAFKELRSALPKDVLSSNYFLMGTWDSFLINNHIDSDVDFEESYRQDLLERVSYAVGATLNNLRLFKLWPAFKCSTSGVQVILPRPSRTLVPFGIIFKPKIRVLFELVPSKKTVVDLKRLSGPKILKSSVDHLLEKAQGYFYRERGPYLTYTRPLSFERLFALSFAQWFKKEGLLFRHNGNSLAVLMELDYEGIVPQTDSQYLKQEFARQVQKRIMRKLS